MIELRPAKYLLGRLAPMDNNDKIPQFNLGAGTYNSTVYLRGDGVWANPLAGAGFVPLTRELTINGVTYDLSANRTWTIDKASVGLGNVDNTSDLNKPISTATQTALNAKENTANKGIPGGYASLAGDGKVPSDQLPSYVDDVIEVANYAALPTVGQTGVIYITLDNNNVYRWAGSVYVQISQPNAVWGSITGTLSNQTDLQNALNAKQDDITLTTTGTSGAATFIGNTLNIPQYSQDLSGYVPYIGATSNVNLGEYGLSAGWIRLDTSPTTYAAGAGGISWNSTDGTADLELLNGVTLQIGQELHFYAKATEVIPNGSAVMFAGVQGNHLLIAKAERTVLNANPNYFMGVATQDFVNNEFGYVTAFGNVRGLNTTAYSLGAVLYYDSTSATPGLLTATMPNANLAKIEVAAVVRVHANQGILMVRPHVMPMLNEIQDVNTNLSKTTPVDADSVLLQDTADSNIWKKLSWLNTKATLKTYFDTLYQGVGSYVPTSRTLTVNGTTYDLSANRSWTIDKASVGLGNVDNTSDLNKPISTATQTALNAKQDNITLTTSGTSGAATLVGATLNIPQYQSVITNPITGTGTTNYVSKFTGSGSIGNSLIFDNGTNVGINTTAPVYPASGRTVLSVNGSTSSLLEFQNGGFINGYVYVSSTLYEQSSADAPQAFLTSNSERMRITAGGNIGIGTTSPSSILHLSGLTTLLTITDNTYGRTSNIGYLDQANLYFANDSNSNTYIGRYNNLFLAYGGGNVGIGTENPLQKLHVNGNILLPVTNSLYFVPTLTTYGIGTPNSSGVQIFTGAGDYIRFGHMSGVDNFTERMRVDGNGNIGIGTTSPAYQLSIEKFGNTYNINPHLAGVDLHSTGNIAPHYQTTYDWFTGSIGSGSFKMRLTNSGDLGIGTTAPNFVTSGRKVLDINGSSDTLLCLSVGGVAGSYFYQAGGNLNISNEVGGYIANFTNGSERMRIAANGNVGLGTTNPFSKLEISGSAQNWANSPSIVFSDTAGTSDSRRWLIGNVATDYGSFNIAVSSDNSGDPVLSKMTIKKDGNVGIGTTNPQAKLDVLNKVLIGEDLTFGGYYGIGWGSLQNGYNRIFAQSLGGSGDGLFLASASGKGIYFRPNGGSTDALTIAANNYIGINTTAPSYPIHLNNPASETGILTTFGSANIYLSHGGWGMGANKFGIGNGSFPSIVINGSNENVGIGTTNPIWKFVVSKGGAAGLEIDPNNGSPGYVGVYSYNRASGSYYPLLFQAANYYLTIGSVGIGTTTIDPSAILQLESTTQGFLPPRMEEYQRDAISAAEGLIIFNINTQELNVWAGGSWRKIAYA